MNDKGKYKVWSAVDYWACVLSAASFVLITAGIPMMLLNLWQGYLMVALSIISAVSMFRIVNPKLTLISEKYESRQKEYLEELNRIIKWQDEKELIEDAQLPQVDGK